MPLLWLFFLHPPNSAYYHKLVLFSMIYAYIINKYATIFSTDSVKALKSRAFVFNDYFEEL